MPAILTVKELYKIMEDNNAEGQMNEEEYGGLVFLVDSGTIKTREQLAEYMSVEDGESNV